MLLVLGAVLGRRLLGCRRLALAACHGLGLRSHASTWRSLTMHQRRIHSRPVSVYVSLVHMSVRSDSFTALSKVRALTGICAN